jgi:hypothetical protein
MTASSRPSLRVTLLSGEVVFEGPRPDDLDALRMRVGAAMCLDRPEELVFCCGGAELDDRLDDAGEEATVVRDSTLGLLEALLLHARARGGALPPELASAGEHRRLMLTAVRRDGLALEFASEDLRNDPDVVLAAVTQNGWALKHASAALRSDRGIVLAATRSYCLALTEASEELRSDRDFVVAVVARSGLALQCASSRCRGDKEVALAAVTQDGRSLAHASSELRADEDVLRAARDCLRRRRREWSLRG